MIFLFTVVAPARSGTMWYSRLLTTAHSFCFHELTTLLQPYPSNLILHDWFQEQVTNREFKEVQRRRLLQCYPTYFARHWERANFGQHIVGNSDHFILEFLPALWLLWPDMRFIFSVRNGINVVQSRFVHYPHIPKSILVRQQGKWQTDDFFAQCCHAWVEEIALMEKSKRWLRGQAPCIETTLEKMTADLEEVKKIWNWIGIGKWDEYADRNQRMLTTPVNARTNAQSIVGWEQIWAGWTRQQRDTFRAICGEVQRRLGYHLPKV